MANIMQNRVDAILDEKTMVSVLNYIDQVAMALPASKDALTLSDEERLTYQSMDVDNKAFAEDIINVLSQVEREFVPPYITASMVQNDVTLFEQMDKLHYALSAALTRVSDVRRIAASEAMNVSNAVYGLSEMGSALGLPGAKAAYEKLKVRYKSNGSGAKEKPIDE